MITLVTKSTDAGPRYFIYSGTAKVAGGYQDLATALRIKRAFETTRRG